LKCVTHNKKEIIDVYFKKLKDVFVSVGVVVAV